MSEETTTPESLETPNLTNDSTDSADSVESTETTETADSTNAAEETVPAVEAVATEETPKRKYNTVPAERETAHDDFDWSISNRNQYIYAKEERTKLEELYDKTLGAVNENEVIKAKVHQITGGDAVLDINFKSDGLVSMSEFKDIEGFKIGDEVDVYVERQEDENAVSPRRRGLAGL